MVKIKAIKNYKDLQLRQQIKVGDEYEVTESRAEQIIQKGYAKIVEAVTPDDEDVKGTAEDNEGTPASKDAEGTAEDNEGTPANEDAEGTPASKVKRNAKK